MNQKEQPTVRIHPAAPTSLIQEIPAADIVHSDSSPLKAVVDSTKVWRTQGRGRIVSDVNGSYTGTPVSGEMPEQDADDL